MWRRNSTLAYLVFIALMFVGAWLVGLFEAEPKAKEITGLDVLLSFLGLVIFVGAIIGVVLVMRLNRQPMTQEQGILWENVRAKGKYLYLRNYVMRGTFLILVSILLLILGDYWEGKSVVDSLKVYGVVALVSIGCVIYAAIRTWDYYEREYGRLRSETQPNNSFNRSAN